VVALGEPDEYGRRKGWRCAGCGHRSPGNLKSWGWIECEGCGASVGQPPPLSPPPPPPAAGGGGGFFSSFKSRPFAALFVAITVGLDEGLLALSLPILVYMDHPYRDNKVK
jgi:hypothetical protein